MKNMLLFNVIFLALLTSACSATYSQGYTDQNGEDDIPYQAPVTDQTFHEDLSPYGQWLNYPGYGEVWAPDVAGDFKPYATNGHWEYSDMGWTWASGYNWGWATFHYGRWFYDNAYGWLWMPGYEWAPAWVSWRSSNDYYGWAPLSPGISFDLAIGGYNPPSRYWCFAPHQYINRPDVCNYYVNESRNVNIFYNTTVINNSFSYNRFNNGYRNNSGYGRGGRPFFATGPNREEVERFTRTPIRPIAIRDNRGMQMNNSQMHLFRPNPVANNNPRYGNDRPSGGFANRVPAAGYFNRNSNAPQMQRPDNRGFEAGNRMQRINPNPVPDNRRNGFNNNNNNFQRPAQPQFRDNRPPFMNQQRRNEAPAYRPNPSGPSNGGGYRQMPQAPQQRMMNQQPPASFNRSMPQAQPNQRMAMHRNR